MSTRPQRVAKTQALQKWEASSDVDMDEYDEELDSDSRSDEDEEDPCDSEDSLYDGKGEGGKRKRSSGSGGKKQMSKRSRKDGDCIEDEDESSSKIEHKPPSRLFRLVTGPGSRGLRSKGRKKTASGNRGLGRLKKLLEMPMDVFCEILECLQPIDLLNLARSSKSLHELLTSRRMRSAWQASLNEHKVPPLPDNVPINEVQLASMLFENTCQSCGGLANNKIFHDQLLVRLCKGCVHHNVTTGTKIASVYGKKVAKDNTLYDLLPCVGRGKYLVPDFLDVIEKYLAAPPDSEERRKLVAERKELTGTICKYARELSRWRREKSYEKHREAGDACSDRRKSITKKLHELGYTDEDINYCRQSDYRVSSRFEAIMGQPRRLTDRIWKSISDELLRYMEEAKKGVRRWKKKEALLSFFKTFCATFGQEHPRERLSFNFSDLLELPIVKATLDEESELTLPDTLLTTLELELPVICKGRAEKLKEECLEVVMKGREEHGLLAFSSILGDGTGQSSSSEEKGVSTTDCPLRAASTTFNPNIGYGGFEKTFPLLMDHFYRNPYPVGARYGTGLPSWKTPEFRANFASDAEFILRELGLPLNVTLEYAIAISPNIRCRSCPQKSPVSWSGWVSHQAWHRGANTDSGFHLKDPEVMAAT